MEAGQSWRDGLQGNWAGNRGRVYAGVVYLSRCKINNLLITWDKKCEGMSRIGKNECMALAEAGVGD